MYHSLAPVTDATRVRFLSSWIWIMTVSLKPAKVQNLPGLEAGSIPYDRTQLASVPLLELEVEYNALMVG